MASLCLSCRTSTGTVPPSWWQVSSCGKSLTWLLSLGVLPHPCCLWMRGEVLWSHLRGLSFGGVNSNRRSAHSGQVPSPGHPLLPPPLVVCTYFRAGHHRWVGGGEPPLPVTTQEVDVLTAGRLMKSQVWPCTSQDWSPGLVPSLCSQQSPLRAPIPCGRELWGRGPATKYLG